MNQTMTKDEVRTSLHAFEGYSRIPIHHTLGPRFERNEFGTLCLYASPDKDSPEREYPVTASMWDAITRDLGAGERYFRNTPPNLLIPQLNWWYGNEGADKELVYALVKQEGEGEGAQTFAEEILRSTAVPVDPQRLFDSFDSAMTNGTPPNYSFLRNRGLEVVTLAAVNPTHAYEVQNVREVGDIVQGGAVVSFSPTGRRPVMVSAYVERLICTNGMTSSDQLDAWTFSGGEGAEDPYEWLPTAVARANAAHDAHFQSIQRMADTPVPEDAISTVVEDLFAHYNMPVALRSAVARQLQTQNVENLWDVVNSFTFAATHDRSLASDPLASLRLMRVAGDAMTHTSRCPECSHLLSSRQ